MDSRTDSSTDKSEEASDDNKNQSEEQIAQGARPKAEGGQSKTEGEENKPESPALDPAEADDSKTIAKQSETSHFWIAGQANIILQWYPSFRAKYSDDN